MFDELSSAATAYAKGTKQKDTTNYMRENGFVFTKYRYVRYKFEEGVAAAPVRIRA